MEAANPHQGTLLQMPLLEGLMDSFAGSLHRSHSSGNGVRLTLKAVRTKPDSDLELLLKPP